MQVEWIMLKASRFSEPLAVQAKSALWYTLLGIWRDVKRRRSERLCCDYVMFISLLLL